MAAASPAAKMPSIAGAAVLVDRDSRRRGQRRAGEPSGVALHADADYQVVDLAHAAVREVQPLHATVPPGPLDHAPGEYVDPLGSMQRAEPAAQPGTEHALQGMRRRLDHCHRGAQRASARGHLLPDEAGADDGEPRAVGEHAAQRDRIVEGPQLRHVVVAGQDREGARPTAGRDQQLRVAQRGAGGQRQSARRGRERRGAGAEQQVDGILLVPGDRSGRPATRRRPRPAAAPWRAAGGRRAGAARRTPSGWRPRIRSGAASRRSAVRPARRPRSRPDRGACVFRWQPSWMASLLPACKEIAGWS